MKFFVDSSAFVALNNANDTHAHKALAIAAKLSQSRAKLYTTNFILAEALTVISQRTNRTNAVAFGNEAKNYVEILRINAEQEDLAFQRFTEIKQKDVSYIDCTCFIVCEQLGITQVFTFDKHFEKQGLKIIKP